MPHDQSDCDGGYEIWGYTIRKSPSSLHLGVFLYLSHHTPLAVVLIVLANLPTTYLPT